MFATAILACASCDDKQTEFGNSRIYFTNSTISHEMLDEQSTEADLANCPDQTTNYITVYRSGVVDNLDEVTITIAKNQQYIADIIQGAEDNDQMYWTDEMKRYCNSKAMPEEYFEIPSEVKFPAGKRMVAVPVKLKIGAIKAYENNYLNYTLDQWEDVGIIKDRRLVFVLEIKSTSKYEIMAKKRYCFFEITKCLTKIPQFIQP